MSIAEEYNQRQPKPKKVLGYCSNVLCKLCKSNECQAPLEIELLCDPQQYIDECKQRYIGEKLKKALEFLFGKELTIV